MDNAAPRPRRSTRRPASKVTWWEKHPKAYLASSADSAAKDGWDLTKPLQNEKDARARPDWPLWQRDIKEEVVAHKHLGTWSKTKVSNRTQKTVKTRFVFDIKHDTEGKLTRYKARLVAQGFKEVPGRDFDETWAPVPSAATTRAIFAVAAANDWEIHHFDVKTAFLNAKMDKEMYIKLPDGVEDGDSGEICRLNLALYGTKQAGRLWGMKLDKALMEMGASRSPVDPCVYEWNHPVHALVFILVYVDDLIVTGKILAGVQAVKSAVSGTFDVRDMAELKDFIGIKVMRDGKTRTITLSRPGHNEALLEAFCMEMATPKKTPMASGVKLAKMGKDLLSKGNRYAALVGSLLYLLLMKRPDISFAVGVLSRILSSPSKLTCARPRVCCTTFAAQHGWGWRTVAASRGRGTSTLTGRATLTAVGLPRASSSPSTVVSLRGRESDSRL